MAVVILSRFGLKFPIILTIHILLKSKLHVKRVEFILKSSVTNSKRCSEQSAKRRRCGAGNHKTTKTRRGSANDAEKSDAAVKRK